MFEFQRSFDKMKSLWILVLLAVYVKIYDTSVRFTNIKCAAFHPDFATFQQCQLKVIARGVIGLNVHVKLWQLPVNNISVRIYDNFLKKLQYLTSQIPG